MYSVNENQNSIEFKLSSEIGLVDRVVRECTEFIKKFDVAKLDNLKVVVRELLLNAIEHGNKKDINKSVECKVERIEDSRFKIEVQDQGEGFDHENLNLLVPDDPEQDRNRGLPLVNALADEIKFENSGSSVSAFLTITRETGFEVKADDSTQVIKPSGDLTASSADKLRIILLEMLDNDNKNYRFDLEQVEDIDSVSLSLLITFAKMHKKKFGDDGTLEITSAGTDLKNLFELTRLNRIYTISS